MAKRGAEVGEAVELYEDPKARAGPRAAHGTRRVEGQAGLLEEARQGRWLCRWLAFPCTGFWRGEPRQWGHAHQGVPRGRP